LRAAIDGVRGARLIHRAGSEVVERNDANHGRRQSGGNPRIAHVGDMRRAIYLKTMNSGMEGLPHLASRPGKIDHDAVGIHRIDGEAV